MWPTQSLSLKKGYESAANQIDSIKRIAQNNRDTMAAGPVQASYFTALGENLSSALKMLSEVSHLAGIFDYISKEEQGARTALAVEENMTAIKAALFTALGEIKAKAPIDADRYLLTVKLLEDGTLEERTFDAAETETLRGLLDALIALID
ncbi:hypothetical protein [Ruegeria jejuensis]|uniref:hypothetical protein n=1 Tax=Ruegeria jejuensis TaxID=3233338 RepID=UPI00355BA9DC